MLEEGIGHLEAEPPPPFRTDELQSELRSVLVLLSPHYVREEAGTQRYNVGTDTPKLCAASCGGVPLANSFFAA
jgi:hypothetical protein